MISDRQAGPTPDRAWANGLAARCFLGFASADKFLALARMRRGAHGRSAMNLHREQRPPVLAMMRALPPTAAMIGDFLAKTTPVKTTAWNDPLDDTDGPKMFAGGNPPRIVAPGNGCLCRNKVTAGTTAPLRGSRCPMRSKTQPAAGTHMWSER